MEDHEMNVVRYKDFGAAGDGETDDLEAIRAAHAFANEHGSPVRAADEARYYLGGTKGSVIIQTDTDFGTAEFIIDDRKVESRTAHVFQVKPGAKPRTIEGTTGLTRGQRNVDVSLSGPSLLVAKNSNVRHFIRRGLNQNQGSPQTDIFLVTKEGVVDPSAPIQWDFEEITELTAFPIDPEPLTLRGGRFLTIANTEESKYTYYARGIEITRSNVIVDGLEHRITGEGEQGAPYHGFLKISTCANITVRNTTLSGHKTYQTIGSAGKPVSMGSYDISIHQAINVVFENCRQFNDIHDRTFWGVMASNFSKNLVLDRCHFSRFDAHQGAMNVTIRDSVLGHMGIKAIGKGTILVEDTRVQSWTFIDLRPDYGSTWEGDVVIRNSTFVPRNRSSSKVNLIGGRNDGQHDFGYLCFMPERVEIDGLRIEDAGFPEHYKGPAVFGNFNPKVTHAEYEEPFPYIKTKKVVLKNVSTASGKPLRVSRNPLLLSDIEIEKH
jgi:hypothetical protein